MRVSAAASIAVLIATTAAAQTIPSEPLTFAGGRVVISGDAAAGIAPEDFGFFNYSDYEQNTLRQFRVGMTGLIRASERISFVGELRSENLDYVTPFALYARIRPLPQHRLAVNIGRIPPTFGTFGRRTYSHDNPLIGYPLAYQYLTSLRADSVPANADELWLMRGRGWLSSYSIGNAVPEHGVPLVSALTWDTGVQVSGSWNVLTATAALTNGTLSNPRVSDDNSGKQIAARLSATPIIGLTVGGSLARGEFLDRHVRTLVPEGTAHDYDQRAEELDLEYSRDHWLARAEIIRSEWRMPIPDMSPTPVPVRALATSVEGRYTFAPGWYGAARAEHLGFSRIESGGRIGSWEAPVTRVELGGGYYLQRNLIARMSVQMNRRDGGRVTSSNLVAMQLLYWF